MIETGPSQRDGIDTVRAIRKLEEYSGRRAAIIGIGIPPGDARQDFMDGGLDDFIDLPVSKDQLKEKLQQLREMRVSC